MGISFFSMLTDSKMSVREATAIGTALDRGTAALEATSAQSDAIGGMLGRLAAQDREIKLLRAAIGVLAAMLRDNGVVDGEMLDIRLEAAMENAEEEIDHAANTVTCPQCNRQVDRRVTVMTEQGIVCDRCHALGA